MQIMYQIQELYPECRKNSYNSTVKGQLIQLKLGKDLSRLLPEKNGCEKKMLNITEPQINSTMKSHLIATWMATVKRQTIISVGQVVEK